jgi:cytoskeletal protein CcmA (bactofilin family)
MESDSASPASESAVSSARAVRQPAMPNFDPENTFSIQSGHPKPGVLVIAAGDIRRGNASFDSDVRIDGQFLGDLDCIATLTVTGSVHGNIQARRIMLQNDSAVLGSIVCNSSISIASGAQIVGNITANSISCGATVRGNLTATESIRLGAAAVIVGDVTAPEVEILPGATIAGTIRAGNASLFGKDSPYHQRQTD